MLRLRSLLRASGTGVALSRSFTRPLIAPFSSLSHLSNTRFAALEITENSKRAIRQELKYEFLTDVQDKTFAPILQGKDVLSKAKTGNGKTMAFLLPAIERLVRHGLDNTPNSIPLLVISPTRELAQQIAVEARKIGQFHDLHVACFVGGTSVHKDAQVLKSNKPVDILVATPGRLLDHIDQDTGHIKKMLRKLQFLVLDEADRLLDMGFRNEVVKIINSVPAQRQTLLFSATLPRSTQELTRLALRKDFELVDTVSEGEHQTNLQVKQEYVMCRAPEVVTTVEYVLTSHMAQFPQHYKVIVFFPTARMAQFMAQLFSAAEYKGVLEMHSRKSQTVRTKTAEKFRTSNRVMLFSSDVSARGVDYPDVSLVVQVGLTDRDSYIHRLGRTARGGSTGHGVLVLADFEKPFLHDLKGLPVAKQTLNSDGKASRTSTVIESLETNPKNAELAKSAVQSYQSWLGFYHSNLRRLGINKEELAELATEYSRTIGLKEVPKLDPKTLTKMGMLGIAGIVPAEPKERWSRTSDRGESKERRSRASDRGESRRSPRRDSTEDDADRKDRRGRASGRGESRARSPRWEEADEETETKGFASSWNDRDRRTEDWSSPKRPSRRSDHKRASHGRSPSTPRRGGRRY